MKLKRVRIFGFKTFADRTDFELDGDLIAIVGPNGCGKSNIVDAILWALGEANARHLRAQTSQDVIFNGSSGRKPLGYAEVTLEFDNEDGSLPVAAAEVSVTRRLTRAGDSTYAINKRACRLKDVYDLLADSGLGRSGYAIVGQREIDQALSASAEDRRAWIDEAAGVQRFRAKRQESLRRLDDATQHLQRVDGILTDLQEQREPLESEAIVAKQYLEVKERLTEIESGLLMVEVCKAVDDLEELDGRIEGAVARSKEETLRAEALEKQADDLGNQIAEKERHLDDVRELRHAQHAEVERAESGIEMARRQLESLDQLEESLKSEQSQAASLIGQAEAELTSSQAELEQDEAQLEQARATMAEVGDATKPLNEELRATDAQLEEASKRQVARHRQEAEREQALRRSSALKKEIVGIGAALPDMESGVAEAAAAHEEWKAKFEQAQRTARDLEAGLHGARTEVESAAKEARGHSAELATVEAKIRGIQATLDAHEGLSQGAAAVMGLVAKGELGPVYRPVAEAINTEEEFATAIETALGAAANDLIVPDEQAAKEAIRILKEHRLGRATFQPLTLMRATNRSQELIRLSRDRGMRGIAADLVECAAADRPVIESLLGRILVAENLDEALRHSCTQGWSRIVTLDGEVLHGSGAVTGGKSGHRNNGIVQRKAELASLEERLAELKKSLSGQASAQQAREDRIAALQTQIESERKGLGLIEQEVREARQWLDKLNSEHGGMRREKERCEKELAELAQVLAVPEIELLDTSDLGLKRDQILAALAKTAADADQAKLRLRELQERCTRAEERVKAALKRCAMMRDGETSRGQKLASLDGEREQLQQRAVKLGTQRDLGHTQVQALARQLEEIAEERRLMMEKAYQLSDEAKQAHKNVAAVADTIRLCEVEKARADSRRANAAARLMEEYGLSQEEALERKGTIEIPADAPALASRLRRELRALGTVNLGAIEAYDRLTERWTTLTAQRDDVMRSKEEIEGGIRELERVTRERFLGTFVQVQERFAEFFGKLFGGGEALISLNQTESILTSGVEIEVTVPGKKKQRLELLSGGERSLCACAFLFALLAVRPSPLVVLDEVDAPLDGRNVERYVDVLKSFRGICQFLLITHNPVTIESAPIWFGVTMKEPGVTTLLPFKAPDVINEVVPSAFDRPEPAGSIP